MQCGFPPFGDGALTRILKNTLKSFLKAIKIYEK